MIKMPEIIAVLYLLPAMWSLWSPLAAGGTEPSEERVPWTTSRIVGTPDPPPPYVVERIFPGIQLDLPTNVTPVPGTNRLIVTQLDGRVVTFLREPDVSSTQLAIDLRQCHADCGQTIGITFHPDYPRQPWCYMTYALKTHAADGTRLCRYYVSDPERVTIDPASELVLATWRNQGHRGGCLEFGPDGFLYVCVGDGNPPNPPDPLRTGQDISDLQSSILRIDVRDSNPRQPYRIPSDNPFVHLPGARGEVWAYGFRNPWKITFDPVTHSLWTGDVGWEMMEMVYRVEKGGNYGWSVMEGSHPVHPQERVGPTPIQPPIVEYSHVEGRSVTGGHFYYGRRLPELTGAYLYGDWMTGKIWELRADGREVTWHKLLADTSLQIIDFAVEQDGQLMVVGYDGTLHRLVAAPDRSANERFPLRLSETGLFASTADHTPRGVIPYSINAHHWSDHTDSEQFLGLVGDARLGIFPQDDWQIGQNQGHFSFPPDTVLAKTVFLDLEVGNPASRRRLETQVLHRHVDEWNAYNYVWNDEQTDAVLQDRDVSVDREFLVDDPAAPGGTRRQVWHHARRDECLLCHIWRAGTVHGFKLEQLDRPLEQDPTRNQLPWLAEKGVFGEPLPSDRQPQVSPYDESFSLAKRARAWLHLNCAHCHSAGGGGTAAFHLSQGIDWPRTRLLESQVTQGTFGIHDAAVLAPGDPYRSILYYRLAKLGRGRMPQFGSSLVDPRGLKLIHDWIVSLASDPPAAARMADLDDASPDELDALLASTDGALLLATAIETDSVSQEQADWIIERGGHHPDLQVRDLFERFLPYEQRVPRLGTSFNAESLLAMSGDVGRGRALWFDAAGVSCRNCHQIDRRGGQVGPDLSRIGQKYRRHEILDNIVNPSRKVDPQFVTWYAETRQGTVFSGLLMDRTEAAIVLRDAAGMDTHLSRDEIELLQSRPQSLMPERLLQDFTAQQAADLLAFLEACGVD